MSSHTAPQIDQPAAVEAPAPLLSATGFRTARAVALVLVVVAAATIALTRGKGAGTVAAASASSTFHTLAATDMVDAFALAATSATGGYVPGTGIVVAVSMDTLAAADVTTTVASMLEPFATRLAELPDTESVVVVVDAHRPVRLTRIVRVSPVDVATPQRWSVIATPSASISPASTGDPAGETATAPATAPATADAPVDGPVDGELSSGSAAPATAAASPESPTAPATPSATATGSVAADTTEALTETFETDDGWSALSGTWAIADGTYTQSDGTGYDYISQLLAATPTTYTVSVRMRAETGPLHAGLIVGQPTRGARDGATLVDITGDGTYLRWGSYATPGGAYAFVGGATLPAPVTDGEWHTLRVDVMAEATRVYLDGTLVGEFAAIASGGLGIVTSQAVVSFDDFAVGPLL